MSKMPKPGDMYATPEMVTMFRIPAERMRQAGIEFAPQPDGSVEFRGEYNPIQMFAEDLPQRLEAIAGSREADRILDMAGSMIQREIFINTLRKVITE